MNNSQQLNELQKINTNINSTNTSLSTITTNTGSMNLQKINNVNITTVDQSLPISISSTNVQNFRIWDPIVSRLGRYTDIINVSINASSAAIDTSEQNFADNLHSLNRNITFPTSAGIIGINSNSILDNGVTPNTGARIILVQGLDSLYNPIQETVLLNGTTKVSTLQSYIIVNFIRVLTAGSLGSNQGYIWASSDSDTFNAAGPPSTNIYILIAPNINLTRCGFYCVKLGYTLLATESSFSSDASQAEVINCNAWLKSGVTGLIYKLSESYITTSTVTFSNQDTLSISEKSILYLTCYNKSGSSKAYANIKCCLVKNSTYPNINFT
jgi:hypothetical protein